MEPTSRNGEGAIFVENVMENAGQAECFFRGDFGVRSLLLAEAASSLDARVRVRSG
jgi:hypothetical protein